MTGSTVSAGAEASPIHAGPGTALPSIDPSRPARLPLAFLAVPWTALALLAGVLWVVTAHHAKGMQTAPGTMGETLPAFVVMWAAMMAAMMFPSVAPVAIAWARSISRVATGWARVGRITAFISGYLLCWTAFGLIAFAALIGAEEWLHAAPDSAKWLGTAVYTVAGLFQLTPYKRYCLRQCRSPLAQLIRYGSFRGRLRDLRVGADHGRFCVGCCWALMLVIVAVGVMNVTAMAALAAVIFLEKLWRRGPGFARLVGIGFLLLAVLSPFHPWLSPALDGGGLVMRM